MTYQELVNKIQTIVNEHYMLADFGYGDLSDLKTRFENTSGNEQVQADYPYCFLNPASHSRNQSAVTYNFNMIVMDMARGEVSDDPFNNMLAIQSQCQQYIDDIIAKLWNDADPKMNVIYSNLTYTPFNERFADDVAGMTANLQIQVSVPINDCIAPFAPNFGDYIIQRRTSIQHTLDFDGYPDGEDNFWNSQQYSYDGITWVYTYSKVEGLGYRAFQPTETAVYKLEFANLCKFNEPEDGSGILKYFIRLVGPGGIDVWNSNSINIPWVSNETVVNVNGTFIGELQAGSEYYFYIGEDYLTIPIADISGYQLVDSNVKLYKAIT